MLINMPKYRPNLMLIITVSLLLMGCSSAYYGTMEKLGYHKRDLMVSRVESARDAQQEAKEQFKSALEKFSSDSLRRSSARKLKQTRQQYTQWKPPSKRPMHLSTQWPKNRKIIHYYLHKQMPKLPKIKEMLRSECRGSFGGNGIFNTLAWTRPLIAVSHLNKGVNRNQSKAQILFFL